MPKRPEQIIKLACLLFAAILCLQLARVVARGTPLKNLTVPALPQLASANEGTNSAASQTAKGTNSAAGTNTSVKNGTNATVAATKTDGTNASSKADSQITNTATTQAKIGETNDSKAAAGARETNAVATHAPEKATNAATASKSDSGQSLTNHSSNENRTNPASTGAQSKTGTNSAAATGTNSTNLVEKAAKAGTNSGSASKAIAKGTGPGGRPEMGKKGPDVPPAMKARIERITQSEILAPVMRPMPMALLGIAGDEAFLRSPEGQTGMVKEGAELGTIKLLKIGTNRVLIEEKGDKKELMIFSGLGGESLVPKEEKKDSKKDQKKEEKKDEKAQPTKTEEKKPNESPTTTKPA